MLNNLNNMQVTDTLFSNAHKGNSPSVLQNIHSDGKNIVIYERDIFHVKEDLKHFQKLELEFCHSGTVQEINHALKIYFESFRPYGSELLKDIICVLSLFEEVTKSRSYRLLLATIKNNMCRRFHTDINDLRLLCTYYGPGTLWLPDEAVNRDALETCGDNECIITDHSLIQQVATGDIAIIKGAIYPMRGTKALVHRSPSIEESKQNRILLRIDTNQFLNF